MLLNDDLSARTRVHAAALDWVQSPAKGVERRLLIRIGDEKARRGDVRAHVRLARPAVSHGDSPADRRSSA